MAILTGEMQFTGTMGGFSAYRMKGSDKIIIRRKGGPAPQQVKKDKKFAITRKQNEEWKACVAASGSINRSLYPLRHLANYNYTGTLTGLCKSIQKDDAVNALGRRSVLLSQHYHKLQGFSLNKDYNFESFVKHPLQYNIDKANGSAAVQLPELIPGIHLTNPNQQPLYRFVFILGAVADIVFDEERKMYVNAAGVELFPAVTTTAWHTAKQKMAAATITLTIDNAANLSHYTLLLAGGIEFGLPVTNTEVRPVKREGAAKVVLMG